MGGGGSLGSCSRLGGFRREKGGREECVVYSHWLRTILLQSWMVSKPAASRRNPSSRVTWCLLRTRPAFVLVCEDHLCHETEVLYEALVSMLRACIDLRHRTFPRQRQGWRLRSSHTEQFFSLLFQLIECQIQVERWSSTIIVVRMDGLIVQLRIVLAPVPAH